MAPQFRSIDFAIRDAVTDGATAPTSCGAMAGSAIEIEVAGMIVRVRGRVMAEALVEVLAAVKRAR